MFVFLCMCILLIGCGAESGAKSVASGYLKAIKTGSDHFEFVKNYDMDRLINVLDYKFLRVISSEKKDSLLTWTHSLYENSSYKNEYSSLEELFSHMIKTFGAENIVSQSKDVLKIKHGTYQEYVLLYDVEHTNALGQKLYSKMYFVVDDEKSGFKVADWYR